MASPQSELQNPKNNFFDAGSDEPAVCLTHYKPITCSCPRFKLTNCMRNVNYVCKNVNFRCAEDRGEQYKSIGFQSNKEVQVISELLATSISFSFVFSAAELFLLSPHQKC